MELLGFFTLLIVAVLNVILFFKIWGMANDVNKILKIMQKYDMKETDNRMQNNLSDGNFNIEDLVVRKSDQKQMRIKEINNWKYHCFSYGNVDEGWLTENDILSWDDFSKNYHK